MRLDLALLRHTFEIWWPHLEKALVELQDTEERESATGYDWLYRPSDLSAIQLNTNCKSIWVVIPIMRHALQTTCVRDVIENNIQRGIKYRFILPRSASNEKHEAREALCRIFSEHAGEKEIDEIVQDEFEKLAVTHFLFLNPKVEDEQHPLRVFLELPVAGHPLYWIEVEKEAAYDFVERFDTISARSRTA